MQLDSDGLAHWRVNGVAAPELDGCFDVDLESSSCTNTLLVHRLGLGVGEAADAPAAYVRPVGFDLERLEQRYARIEDDGPRRRFDCTAPVFGYDGRLVYDASGLVSTIRASPCGTCDGRGPMTDGRERASVRTRRPPGPWARP